MQKSEDFIMIGDVGGSGTRVFAKSMFNAGNRSMSDLNRMDQNGRLDFLYDFMERIQCTNESVNS